MFGSVSRLLQSSSRGAQRFPDFEAKFGARDPRGTVRRALLVATLATYGRSTFADPTPSLSVEPSPAGDRTFLVERAAAHGRLAPSMRILTDYARSPLALRNQAAERDDVVSHQMWAYAMASMSLAHRWVLHAAMPVVLSQDGGEQLVSGATAPRVAAGVSLGDTRMGARWRIFESAEGATWKLDLALASAFWFPTAGEGYTGDGAVRARSALVLEGATTRVYWLASGGVRTRPYEAIAAIVPARIGSAIALGLGAGFYADARQRIAFGIEAVSDLTFGGGTRLFDPRGSVGHALATAHLRPGGGPLEIGVAFGPGFGEGVGSADFRVLATMGFAFERAAPPSDEDGDGVPDKADACPDLRGVASSDPLLDGCPAIPIDRDGDGIPDENDACPGVAGESTRVKATHGCPIPPDVDKDGVPDENDACPREPGVAPPAGNGCPKAAEPPATQLAQQAIVLSQQVQFETGTAVLRNESDGVLTEVARILIAHPDIELLEVQGHTDEVGSAEYNRQLGQSRASSVVDWLAAHGVERSRLTARGYGSDRPIAENASEEGRQKNRRVEFKIVRRKAAATKSGRGK